MNPDIQKILEAGCQAPSGSNSQPWRFEVHGNTITVIALPEKDHPILNFKNRGTWVAHGALIENILIACNALGYKADLKVFPDANRPNVTAVITLTKSAVQNDPLYPAIPLRSTNRKPYKKTPLSGEESQMLLTSNKEVSGAEFRLVDNYETKMMLGQALSASEIVMLENEQLHKLFFEEITWTKKEQSVRMSGLYLKTMELPLPPRLMLRVLKHWSVMKLAIKTGLPRFIAKGNGKTYSASGAIGAIIVPNGDNASFIAAGRLMQRVWLKATRLKLSAHLITGTQFFHQSIAGGAGNIFSPEHVNIVENAYQKIAGAFGITDSSKLVALCLRIGYDGSPSATSSKKPPQITVAE